MLLVSRLFHASFRPALWVVFVWMGVGFLFVAFFGLADAGRLIGTLVQRMRSPVPADPARRVFLARSLRKNVLPQTFLQRRSRSNGVVMVKGCSLGTYQLFRPVRFTSR